MNFTAQDLGALCELLRAAARTEIMPRFRRLPPEAIRCKSGPLDFVTDADEAAERMITAGLRARFADCIVVGEEAAAATPTLLDSLSTKGLAFVVDPIDGTANYAAGLPLFGCMAAAIEDGQVVAACILDPVTDNAALALKGQGAWSLSPDGRRPLAVASPAPYAEMTGTLSWRFLPEPQRTRTISNALGLAGAWDFRCAAHQYRLLAEAQSHFSLYNRVLPWDHAPGCLIHQEAGGHGARFDGTPYSPRTTTGGLLCAPDEASWLILRERLLGA